MIITEFRKTRGCNGQRDRREPHFKFEVSVIAKTDKGFHVPVTIREYSTPSKVSFCIWTSHNGADASGSGSGSGYGATMLKAMESTGMVVRDFDGNEYSTALLMEAVARVIMQYFDYRSDTYFIHTAHA